MRAVITEIGEITTSSRHGEPYQPVYFKLDDGKSARTYLSPTNGNYSRWKKYLTVGVVLIGLKWKNESQRLINADSFPYQEKVNV